MTTNDYQQNEDLEISNPGSVEDEEDMKVNDNADMVELENYLEAIGFIQYLGNFMQHGFNTLNALKELSDDISQEDLDKMGITKLAHQKKLLKALQFLNYQEHLASPGSAINSMGEGVETGFL